MAALMEKRLASVKGSSKQGSMGVRTTACNGGSVYEFETPANATGQAIALLVEHLTVDHCSDQMVPGSIPGGRMCLVAGRLGRSPRKNCKNDLDDQT